jgi:hypothetical protein
MDDEASTMQVALVGGVRAADEALSEALPARCRPLRGRGVGGRGLHSFPVELFRPPYNTT